MKDSLKGADRAANDNIGRGRLNAESDGLRSDPVKFIEMANEAVRRRPDDSNVYFDRHFGWKALGRLDLALADLDRSLALENHPSTSLLRANLLRDMGRHAEAIKQLNDLEADGPGSWPGGFGHLFRADSHARLGNLEAALADCAMLPDNHWTPGLLGAPSGRKGEVTERIREIAMAARQGGGSRG
jgi:tetratricopeptide (TPR) repeat protein